MKKAGFLILLSSILLIHSSFGQTCSRNCASCYYSNGYSFCRYCFKSKNTKGACDQDQTESTCVLNTPNGNCERCKSTYVVSVDGDTATCRVTSRTDVLCIKEVKQENGSWKCVRCRRSVPTANGKCTHFLPDDQGFKGCEVGELNKDGKPGCAFCGKGYYRKYRNGSDQVAVCASEDLLVYKGCKNWDLNSQVCNLCDSENGYFKVKYGNTHCTLTN